MNDEKTLGGQQGVGTGPLVTQDECSRYAPWRCFQDHDHSMTEAEQ